MSSFLKRVAHGLPVIAAAAAFAVTAWAGEQQKPGYYGYGTTPTAAQIAGWDIAVRPDGQGLPPGSGSVSNGADIYADQCAACHGTFGEGEGRYPKLAGGEGRCGPSGRNRPSAAIGRSPPRCGITSIARCRSRRRTHCLLTIVYAITAYVLNMNNIVGNDFVAERDSLPKVKMPNHDHFIWQDPRPDTSAKECMKDCVDPKKIKIESTAEGKGLTPRTTGPLDEMQPK